MSSRGQGCGGSGDMQGHAGAATREGRGQEDGDATREYRKEDREAGQARTCIHVFYTASLCVPSAVSVLVGYCVVSGQSHA